MTRQITNLIELVYIAQHDSQDNLHSLLLTNNIQEKRKMKLKECQSVALRTKTRSPSKT